MYVVILKFNFNFLGLEEGVWFIDFKIGLGKLGQGEVLGGANCIMILDSEDFVKMFKGELKVVLVFMFGKLKI